ncbi:hypothetical protein NSDW_02780 [Novosphingobium olei]|nr:hypothetical protein NSDW_02780 [Novosphingobium olei]
MAEQALDGAQIARRPVDDRCLRSAQRVGAIFTLYQANPRFPFVDQPGVLAGAEVTIVINPAWKDVIVHCAATLLEPGQQTGPGIGKQFELNWTTCLLLHQDSPRSDLPTANNVANFHLHEVAATELYAVTIAARGQAHF